MFGPLVTRPHTRKQRFPRPPEPSCCQKQDETRKKATPAFSRSMGGARWVPSCDTRPRPACSSSATNVQLWNCCMHALSIRNYKSAAQDPYRIATVSLDRGVLSRQQPPSQTPHQQLEVECSMAKGTASRHWVVVRVRAFQGQRRTAGDSPTKTKSYPRTPCRRTRRLEKARWICAPRSFS